MVAYGEKPSFLVLAAFVGGESAGLFLVFSISGLEDDSTMWMNTVSSTDPETHVGTQRRVLPSSSSSDVISSKSEETFTETHIRNST